MNANRRLLLLAAALLTTACHADATIGTTPSARVIEDGVALELDRETFEAGSIVDVRIVNGTTRGYGFNLCGRSFERRDGDEWTLMPPELRLCTAHLDGLPAGAARSQQTDIPADFAPGTYRMLLALFPWNGTGEGQLVTAASRPFQVR